MPIPKKCDTGKTSENLLFDDGARSGWCRRCYVDAEEDFAGFRCRTCKVIHLKVRMFEKLEGWLCRDCAKEYDQALLAKMAQPQVSA